MAEAARLGPGLPPILMRAAIMFLRNEEPRGALPYTRATLGATREFDGIIYTYYARSGIPVADLIRSGVPVERAAGQAWLRFLTIGGAPRDFEQVWLWLKQNGFTDDPLAGEYVRHLLRNKKYVLAAERWEEQIRDRSPDYRRPELLSNRFWKYTPLACPLDWLINPVQGVETSFSDGLLIRFDTRETLQYEGVVRQAVVSPGPYRLRAEVSSEGITTNEGPCFRVVDAERSERLDVYSRATLGTTERGPVNLDFAVPAGTSLVNVEVFRRRSMKFDNKIKGTLRVHSISLAPINARTGTTSSAANAAK